MALAARMSAVKPQVAKAQKAAVVQKAARAVVRPQQKAVVAGAIATVAALAAAAAPAEAANVISTVAGAAEGYPFVPPEWAPAVFTPLVGLVLPAIGMATLFVYIEKEAPQQ